MLCQVDKEVDVVVVSSHVLVLYQPLDLLFNHLLRRQKHVFENVDQLRLQLCVGYALAHLEDFDDGLLRPEDAQLNDALVVFLASLLRAQLQTADEIQFPSLLELPIFQYSETGSTKG